MERRLGDGDSVYNRWEMPVLKKLVFFTFMFVVFIVSSILLSEIMLRAAGWGRSQELHTASQEVFDSIPGMFEPDQHFINLSKPQLPHRISINSLGFRGAEVRLSESKLRILCLGDSFTFGDYVSDDETFPHMLKQLFDEKIPGRIEVINAGVGGTTIVDQLNFLQKSLRVHPDVVVLTFYENDISGLSRDVPMYVEFERNRKLKSKPGVNLLYGLTRDSALFAFALETRAKLTTPESQQSEDRAHADGSQTFCEEKLLKAYEGYLREMKSLLDSHSMKLMLALYPSHQRWTRLYDDGCGPSQNQLDRVEQIATGMGIAALNLLPTLKQSNVDVRQLYLLPYDGHASKEANRIVADAIYGFLQDRFLQAFDNTTDRPVAQSH